MKSTDLWRAIRSRESRVMTFCQCVLRTAARWTSVSVEPPPIDRERGQSESTTGTRFNQTQFPKIHGWPCVLT
jgi:hypothetical protein